MKILPRLWVTKSFLVTVVLLMVLHPESNSQNLYTARSYWQESTKPAYLTIKQKKEGGQAISADEESYLKDYESYLSNYYNRLSDEEKQVYQRMVEEWNKELAVPLVAPKSPGQQAIDDQDEFVWRGRDRAINAMYGIYYGASLAAIFEFNDAAAAGVPLITGGLWMLGPAFNSKKYQGISESTMRAANTGKILGLVNGLSLGLAIGGDSDGAGKLALGLSTVGSIALGEIAFQTQKRKTISDGRIEMIRHYGFLGPLVGGSLLAATDTDNPNLIGLGLLAGGVGGIITGNKMANKYDYTRGDVDALSALGVISTGIGFSFIVNELENSNSSADFNGALWLVPASTAVVGTLIGQRMVRGVYLTKRQGSTINLSSAGGALFGLGVMLIVQSDHLATWLAVPSATALLAHQIVFNRYKKDNLLKGLQGEIGRNKKIDFSMKLMPENYFVNKNTPQRFIADPRLAASAPLVNMSFKFK